MGSIATPVPLVDLRLQLVAGVQQSLVLRGQVGDLVDARQKLSRVDIGGNGASLFTKS